MTHSLPSLPMQQPLMRWFRTSLTALALALPTATLGSPSPAEIISVDYGSPPAVELSSDEQDRIDTLFSSRTPLILSELSPDGSTMVVATASNMSELDYYVNFLNVKTGELTESTALAYEFIDPASPIRWLSNDVLQYVQSGLYGPWEIVTLNRKTGIISRTTVQPTEVEEGEILGISPDFSHFVVQVYGETGDVISLISLPSLERVEVAQLPDNVEIKEPSWSADGSKAVFVATSAEERQLYERTPYSPSFAEPVVQDALGRTPADENTFRQENFLKVYNFDLPDNPLQFELTATDEGETDIFMEAAISPDGQKILVKMARPSHVAGRENPSYLFPEQVYYRIYSLEGELLTTIDRVELSGPLESKGKFATNDQIVFASTVGHNRQLFVYDLATEELRSLPLPSGSVGLDYWQASPDGRDLFYIFSSVTQPPELFKVALDGSRPPEQITSLNADVAAANQVQVHEVSFSTRNGERQGILIQPRGAAFPPTDDPIVFWQQGGPGYSVTNEFATEVEMPFNLLPNFGISVLAVPLSGREGFGAAFYRALADNDNFGRIDIFEGLDIVNQLVSQQWATSSQLGITGCSYGGYYTSQAISLFPGVFAAANPQCSLLDTLTEWQLGYSSLLSYLVGKTPMEDPSRYQSISPLYEADRIRTPTMIFHGSDDFLQVDVARNFHDVLHLNNVPVTMYEFVGEGHSLYDIEYQRMAAQMQIDFFRQYLKP